MASAAPSAAAPAAGVEAAQPTSAMDQHLAAVQALTEATQARDAGKMAARYAPDAELTVVPAAGTLRGRDRIAADWAPYFEAFPDFRIAVKRVWLTGDVAIVDWISVGTNTGNFLGIKATGRRAGQSSLGILWFDGQGLIAREHLYEDGGVLLAQLSGQPAPPPPTLPEKAEVHYAGSPADAASLSFGKVYMDAIARKDTTKILSLLTDDFEMDLAMAPAPERGKEAAQRGLERFTTAFPDARFSIANAWGVREFAIFEYALQGTQDGPLGPIPPTHKKVDWHWVRILEVRGDKIARAWGYSNSIELLGEIGALSSTRPASSSTPPPPPKPH
jgi:predicted ester cyclase